MRRLFRAHPPGLFVCAATEMWERFSYYGMRALLIFYLMEHFLFGDQAYVIYGAYTALVYLAPLIGGAVSDRWLGARKAVTLGAILLVLGHFGMAFEGPPAVKTMIDGRPTVVRNEIAVAGFYLSLSLIIVGVGFLKTNISAVVGALYPPADRRRDSGFTVFYMCYNLGGAIAPLLCGWLGRTYGWKYGFGLAGIGMLGGLFVFLRGQRLLEGHAEPPNPARLREKVTLGVTRETLVYVGSALFVVAIWIVLQRQQVVGQLLSVIGVGAGAWILYYGLARCTPDERRRLFVCAFLTLVTIGFWAFYEQMGSSLNVFADRVVNRRVFGFEIEAATLQSLPSIFVILLAPWFSALWLSLGNRGKEPGTAAKFSLAIGLLGLGFLVLALGTKLTGGADKVPLIWFVFNFLFLVLGELCLAPVGLSMVTKLSPKRVVGVMMGAFFLAYSASSFIAGLIARLTSVPSGTDTAVDSAVARAAYISVYGRLGAMAVGLAVLLGLVAPLLERATRPARPAGEPVPGGVSG